MNNIIKKFGKIGSIITGIGAFIVGALILGISIFAYVNYHDLDGKTTAIISNIEKTIAEHTYIEEEDLDSEDIYEYIVYVDYEVDGKEYKNIKYDGYNSSMKIGDSIEIKYDTNDPGKIQGKDGKTFIIAFTIIGGLVSIFGIYEVIKGFKIDKENPMYAVMKDQK